MSPIANEPDELLEDERAAALQDVRDCIDVALDEAELADGDSTSVCLRWFLLQWRCLRLNGAWAAALSRSFAGNEGSMKLHA